MKISIIIPVYNEEKNIDSFYESLSKTLKTMKKNKFEILYVDDGSRDSSVSKIESLQKNDSSIRIIKLLRNFGKEVATTAGIHHSTGDAVLMIDADGQHPVELIPDFIKSWQQGSKLTIGVRLSYSDEGLVKKYGSKIFYAFFNSMSGNNLIPGSTDFRIIDRSLVDEFNKLTERNRITRGLIDWLGEKPEIINFIAKPRTEGEAGYKFSKLVKLALTSFLSLSFKPLYAIGYLGLVITPLALITGIAVFIQDKVLSDPLNLSMTGSGYLGIILVFLVGLILISQGLVAVYISYIYEEVRNRPLYILDKRASDV